jgi:hypothetical protein
MTAVSKLDAVLEKYSDRRTKRALSGWIPMDEFNRIEADIRPEIRKRKLRVWYRGPRPTGYCVTATVRKNATHAVLYTV